jgi:hypothetical protein
MYKQPKTLTQKLAYFGNRHADKDRQEPIRYTEYFLQPECLALVHKALVKMAKDYCKN